MKRPRLCRCGNYRTSSRYTGGPLCDRAHSETFADDSQASRMLRRIVSVPAASRCRVLDCPKPTHGADACYVHAKEYTPADVVAGVELMTPTQTLARLRKIAVIMDDAFDLAIKQTYGPSATRWTVDFTRFGEYPAMESAYQGKIEADDAVRAFFDAMRAPRTDQRF